MWKTLKEIQWGAALYQRRVLGGASTNEKFFGITVLNAKRNISKRINVLFIVHFCLGKYSFSHNTFWIYLIFIWVCVLYILHTYI